MGEVRDTSCMRPFKVGAACDAALQGGATAKYNATRVLPGVTISPAWSGNVGNPLPSAADLPPIPVSPLFAEALNDRRCPRCEFGDIWFSPETVPEATLHLNPTQTAFMWTAGEALARMTGDDAFRVNAGRIITELLRTFLLTPPAMAALKWDERAGQVGRDATTRVTWVETATPPPAANPVETVATEPPAVEAEALEPIDPTEHLYTESPEVDDLYGEAEGDTHE